VDNPANQKEFLVIKREEEVKDDLIKIDLEARLEDLTDEQVSGFFGAIKQLWEQEMQVEMLEDIGASIVASMVAREVSVDWDDEFVQATGVTPNNPEKRKGGNDMTFEEMLEKVEDEDLRKSLKEAYEEEIEKEEEVEKGEEEEEEEEEEEVEKSEDKDMTEIEKRIEEIEKRAKIAEEVAKREREKRLNIEFEKRAEAYETLGEKSDMAELLRKASDAELLEDLEPVLKSAAKRIEESDLFVEKGQDTSSTNGATSAEERLEKMASEIVQKDSDMSIEQAKVKVLDNNPELYREYHEEVS